MTISSQDDAVLRDAIAREQLPPWSTNSKRALAANVVVFVAAAIGHYFEWPGAGALVTLAVLFLLVVLATAPQPKRRTPRFYLQPVSVGTIQMLIERLSPECLGRLDADRNRDQLSTLRNGHLLELLSAGTSAEDQDAVWSAWKKK